MESAEADPSGASVVVVLEDNRDACLHAYVVAAVVVMVAAVVDDAASPDVFLPF